MERIIRELYIQQLRSKHSVCVYCPVRREAETQGRITKRTFHLEKRHTHTPEAQEVGSGADYRCSRGSEEGGTPPCWVRTEGHGEEERREIWERS